MDYRLPPVAPLDGFVARLAEEKRKPEREKDEENLPS